jgi:hypothetical protein
VGIDSLLAFVNEGGATLWRATWLHPWEANIWVRLGGVVLMLINFSYLISVIARDAVPPGALGYVLFGGAFFICGAIALALASAVLLRSIDSVSIKDNRVLLNTYASRVILAQENVRIRDLDVRSLFCRAVFLVVATAESAAVVQVGEVRLLAFGRSDELAALRRTLSTAT